MVKEYHLCYNIITKTYIFVAGKTLYKGDRQEWGAIVETKTLISKLKENIDLKRNSLLHLKNIPEFMEKPIVELIVNTKVDFIFE